MVDPPASFRYTPDIVSVIKAALTDRSDLTRSKTGNPWQRVSFNQSMSDSARPQDPTAGTLGDRTDHSASGTEMVESPRRNGRATSRENLHGVQVCYDYGGTTSGNGSSSYNEDDEDQIVDILARLGDDGDDDQCMVTQEEDGWAKTVAGVAGNGERVRIVQPARTVPLTKGISTSSGMV